MIKMTLIIIDQGWIKNEYKLKIWKTLSLNLISGDYRGVLSLIGWQWHSVWFFIVKKSTPFFCFPSGSNSITQKWSFTSSTVLATHSSFSWRQHPEKWPQKWSRVQCGTNFLFALRIKSLMCMTLGTGVWHFASLRIRVKCCDARSESLFVITLEWCPKSCKNIMTVTQNNFDKDIIQSFLRI